MKYPLPAEIFESDIAILGKKGGGKTYTAKGMVEQLLDQGQRVLILDPLGVWAGLRTSADGKKPGYPIAIFGGEHADLPLEIEAAESMANVLAKNNVPAVLDISELSKNKQQAFLLKFLHELRRVNKNALTLVLEEADHFAPQTPMGDDSKQLHGEIDWIARRGRFRGFRLITVTQRPARLSKDVLTQCATMIAHRLPSPNDRIAIRAWVDGNGDPEKAKEVFATLSKLQVGEAWVWATEQDFLKRVRFPTIKTLDTSATPKAGESRIEPKRLADVDLSGIRAALEQTIEEPKENSRKTIGQLNVQKLVSEAEARGYQKGLAVGTKQGGHAGWNALADNIRNLLEDIPPDLAPIDSSKENVPSASNETAKSYVTSDSQPINRSENGSLTPIARKILHVLRAAHPLSLTYKAAAMRAGASPRSSAFRIYRQQILDSGEVTTDGDRIKALRGDPSAPAPSDPLELFASRLSPSYAGMLRVIAASQGPIDRNAIADAAGVSRTSSGLMAGLRELTELELIHKRSDGNYEIAEELQ